jgi:2,4-dienoyl-CoA reductase-like NADH-dependent reductase (Old Yellow Enzyme family)/thioredoxin reductase
MFASVNGEVTPQVLNHYAERAKGGASLIIVEATAVDGNHTWLEPQLRIDREVYIAGLHRLTEAIHINDALACIQLHHAGMWGYDPVAPSDVPCIELGVRTVRPRPLSIKEIQDVREFFSEAALRAKRAGLDMVELHGGTSYLLQQFVSPHTNKRKDQYGGNLEGRIRLSLEIVKEIKEKCGADFPIGYRMVADELLPDGINIEESKSFARYLEKAGIAYLSVQLGTYETFNAGEGQFAMRSAKGNTNKYTKALKEVVSIPVFACQQIHDPLFMEEVLERRVADIIALGRPLLVDPFLPKKLMENKAEDIRMCLRCGQCYSCVIVEACQIRCPQNPQLGREREYAILPSSSPKKVLVIGGGPAGLEAARVGALRGHEIILMEKEPELGGQLKIASLPIGKQDYKTFVIDWQELQCKKANVKIELNKEVTSSIVEDIKPQVIIVATGANIFMPSSFGINSNNVVTAWDVLKREVRVGKRVVVAGGGMVGVEVADFLVENGLSEDVTIIEKLPDIATDMELMNRAYIINKLEEYNVKVIKECELEEITERGVVVMDKEKNKRNIEADTVVIALGSVSNNGLQRELESKNLEIEIYTIGDCRKPRKLLNAIHEGFYVGLQI